MKKKKKDKNKNTTLSEQFKNTIKKSLNDAKSIPLTHIYMIAFYPGLVQAPQQKVVKQMLCVHTTPISELKR